MIALQLSKWGHASTGAPTAEATLQLLKDRVFDLVLIDARMAGTGEAPLVSEMVSTVSPQERPVIIALAPNFNPAERTQLLQIGVDDCLHQPIKPDELGRRLNLVLKRRTPSPPGA